MWETLGSEAFGKNELSRAAAGKVLHRMLWKVSFESCLEFQKLQNKGTFPSE